MGVITQAMDATPSYKSTHMKKSAWPPKGMKMPSMGQILATIEENRRFSLYALMVGTGLTAAVMYSRRSMTDRRRPLEPSTDSLFT
uniref:HIG1 domain-containing protein n=1 Tax=Globodera pallida TaxID=36090 RepID=A0A183C4T4_GLOPA